VTAGLEEGDHVTIAPSGKVHWIIVSISGGHAFMRSGMTGRKKRLPLANLRLHTKGASSS
jgi:hypothetical protein